MSPSAENQIQCAHLCHKKGYLRNSVNQPMGHQGITAFICIGLFVFLFSEPWSTNYYTPSGSKTEWNWRFLYNTKWRRNIRLSRSAWPYNSWMDSCELFLEKMPKRLCVCACLHVCTCLSVFFIYFHTIATCFTKFGIAVEDFFGEVLGS
jgi:hypothetical protein